MEQPNSINLPIDAINNELAYYSNGIVRYTEQYVTTCCQCSSGPYSEFHDICTSCDHIFDACCHVETIDPDNE
jgi:hypothetical protein